MNEIVFSVSAMCLVVFLLIFLLKKLKQPYIVAYMLAGVLIGPFAGKLFVQPDTVNALGEIGILFLMFFLGIEIDIPDNKSLLIKPVFALGLKILIGTVLALVTGFLLHWPSYQTILLIMLLTFNSTAVVSEYLAKNGELRTSFGKTVLNVLLLQDILLAPALTLFQFFGKGDFSLSRLFIGVLISIFVFVVLRAIRNKTIIRPSFLSSLEGDHELQIFIGAFICLGFGLLAELAGLSGAIGSFIAGMVIGRTEGFRWLESALKPFRVFFVSFFFMSIGLRIDLSFIANNIRLVLIGTIVLLTINSLASAAIMRILHFSWRKSFYGGALLSQGGEFGILACSLAYEMHIINADFFRTGIAITALSLLLSTAWITVLRSFINRHVTTWVPPAKNACNKLR